jgi:hypothetical protein
MEKLFFVKLIPVSMWSKTEEFTPWIGYFVQKKHKCDSVEQNNHMMDQSYCKTD